MSASTEKHLKRKIELAFIVPAQQQKRQQQKSVDSVSWTLIWQRKHTKTPPENYWFVVEVDSCLLFECVRFVSLHELCFKKTSLWCVVYQLVYHDQTLFPRLRVLLTLYSWSRFCYSSKQCYYDYQHHKYGTMSTDHKSIFFIFLLFSPCCVCT